MEPLTDHEILVLGVLQEGKAHFGELEEKLKNRGGPSGSHLGHTLMSLKRRRYAKGGASTPFAITQNGLQAYRDALA